MELTAAILDRYKGGQAEIQNGAAPAGTCGRRGILIFTATIGP